MASRGKGRPRKYRNVSQLQEKIAEYFHSCSEQGSIPTKAGLCYHLGFADPAALSYYTDKCRARNHFSKAIKLALLRIQAEKIQWLLDGDLPAGKLRGLCFDLRVNSGSKERAAVKVEEPGVGGVQVVGWEKFNENWRDRVFEEKA